MNIIDTIKSLFVKTPIKTKEQVVADISSDKHLDVNDIYDIMQKEEKKFNKKAIIKETIRTLDDRIRLNAKKGYRSTTFTDFIGGNEHDKISRFPKVKKSILSEIESHYESRGFEVYIPGRNDNMIMVSWDEMEKTK